MSPGYVNSLSGVGYDAAQLRCDAYDAAQLNCYTYARMVSIIREDKQEVLTPGRAFSPFAPIKNTCGNPFSHDCRAISPDTNMAVRNTHARSCDDRDGMHASSICAFYCCAVKIAGEDKGEHGEENGD